jgi:hypothetical protein
MEICLRGEISPIRDLSANPVAIQWEGTQSSTKKVLEFMGQKVCTRTQIACDKFFDYASSVRKNGLPVTTEFGEVTITQGTWILKEPDGTLSVFSDRNFKRLR